MSYMATTLINDEDLKSKKHIHMYYTMAKLALEVSRDPDVMRTLRANLCSRDKLIKDNLENGVYSISNGNELLDQDQEMRNKAQKLLECQKLRLDGAKKSLGEVREKMAEAKMPWFNRSVNVTCRDMKYKMNTNPFMKHTKVGDQTIVTVDTEALVKEVKEDLLKHFSKEDFAVFPLANETSLGLYAPPELEGAVVVFSEAHESRMKQALADIGKDRIMTHPDIGGDGSESFAQLRGLIGGSSSSPLSPFDAITMLGYEFRTSSMRHVDNLTDAMLFEGNVEDYLENSLTFDEQRVFLMPSSVESKPEVQRILEKRKGHTGKDDEAKFEVELMAAFVEEYRMAMDMDSSRDMPF